MLWLQSIDFVRKAVSEEQDKDSDPTSAPYLSSITSLFLSRTSNVLTQPLNKLYEPLTNYIIVKDRIDLKTVPEMLLLLHSPNPEYKAHRVWMLELLRDGLKTMDDFEILINSCAYKLIMEFYTCGICDKDSKILILNIINNTIKIPKAAKILTEGHGLLPWLLGIIISLNQTDIDLVSANISLINNLRCSLVAYQIYDNLNSGNDKVIKDKNFILSDHTTTFLCSIMIMLSHKLSPRLNSKIMTKYLKTSYHITTYKKIFNANDMENLINMCDKIFRKDSECRILFQTKGKHAESLKVLIDLVLNCESDGIVDYGIKYLKLLTKKYLEQEAS